MMEIHALGGADKCVGTPTCTKLCPIGELTYDSRC